MKLNARLGLFAFILVTLTVIVKIICAPVLALSGFTTIIAIALFAGMYNNKENSFLLPLAALFVSDVIIEILYTFNWFAFKGFYKGQWLNYLLLAISVLIGWMVKGKKIGNVFLAAIAAPTVYFLLSNFTVWMSGTMYATTWDGLVSCYTMALPFYKNQLLSTGIFLPGIIITYNYLHSNTVKAVL